MIDLEKLNLLCKRVIDWELTQVDSSTAHELAHETINLISLVVKYEEYSKLAEKISSDLWLYLEKEGAPIPIIMLKAKELRSQIKKLEEAL